MSITRVASNSNAFLASAQLAKLDNSLGRTLERLSSGLRINRGADDPAGITTSSMLRSQISSLEAAIQNVQEAVGMFSVVDNGLASGMDLMTRMKDITIKAGNSATLTTTQLSNLAVEFDTLLDQMYNQFENSSFGDLEVLTGALSITAALGFQIGINSADFMTVDIPDIRGNLSTKSVGLSGAAVFAFDVTTSVQAAFDQVTSAITVLSNALGSVGRQASRLDFVLAALEDQRANAIAANSNVVDADLAAEITNLATGQIRAQAATAALAQANALPNLVVQLLGQL